LLLQLDAERDVDAGQPLGRLGVACDGLLQLGHYVERLVALWRLDGDVCLECRPVGTGGVLSGGGDGVVAADQL
jgi:hypothetical protein